MNILGITDVPTDLDPNDVQVDDPHELREDRDDDREEEEPDQARGLRGASDPPNQAGEEEREAEADQDVGEDLEEVKIEALEVKVVQIKDQGVAKLIAVVFAKEMSCSVLRAAIRN